ncbi:MAG: SurA N-terminal domain-containing protein [Thermodesulfovibrionales bacterium]|nr:SurA N-terminal domain-containing protein [Nitrospinota bacterium]MCG2709500.1 SurA N-terminal domain-containing protein [Thermodesulfovibrionales bacterium]MCG2813300.1 SurA N-terminal domain-containing protein [Thermodesulfovibrionales bacterium]MDP3048769.1 SurA N-terminal domain-containing protein [Thermodesulfovibrionales bacterium]
MKKIAVFVLTVFLVLGCAKKEEQKGQYLVKINGVAITKEDLKKEVEALPPFAQKMFEGEEGIARLIDELIKKELLYQEAKKKGLDRDAAYLKKVADSQKLILISALLEKEIEDKAKLSDKDVMDFYEKNKADFMVQGKTIEFEKVRDMLAQRLTAQKQKEVFDGYVESLKKSYKIDVNKEAIAGLSKKEETKKEDVKKEEPKK